MRVPDEILKCVAFIGAKPEGGDFAAAGTVFFIGHDIEGVRRPYAVTAKHVVQGLQGSGVQDACIRYSTPGGVGFSYVKTEHWFFHPDPTVDLAVNGVVALDHHDQMLFPSWQILENSEIERYDVNLGEQVVFPGLFVHHHGTHRNIPIVRLGSLAALGGERVLSEGVERDAFLIEARSIGGYSGAPVFFDLGRTRQTQTTTLFNQGSTFRLVGIVHGHFRIDARTLTNDRAVPLDPEKINAGIAIVTPGEKLLEIFETGRGELGHLPDFHQMGSATPPEDRSHDQPGAVDWPSLH